MRRVIDHLVLATPDLDETAAELSEQLGVAATPGGKHVGLGTHNALIALGDEVYLEVIGPDPDQPAPASPRPFGIDALPSARLVTWAARVDDIEARVSRAKAAGYDAGPVVPMSRDMPDGRRLEWRLTFPPADGNAGVVPFLIDWGSAPHPSTTAATGARLLEFFGEHPDVDAVNASLTALGVELDVRPASAPGLVAVIEGRRGRVEL